MLGLAPANVLRLGISRPVKDAAGTRYFELDGVAFLRPSLAVRRNHFPIAAKLSGNTHPLVFRNQTVFSVILCSECFMSNSFHNADRRTYRKVMVIGLLFCAAFVVFSFFAREQPANTYVLKKADRLVRTAGSAVPAN